VLKNQLTERPF